MRSVFSASRCIPIEPGAGPPAAAQLPAPCICSCAARHSSSSRRACAKILWSMDQAIASAVPPAVSVEPRITTSQTSPSSVSICALLERRPSPNLVDSSQPKDLMRLHIATRNAAMASDATVSSPRILLISRSHGSVAGSASSALMASVMLALIALGATRRESCAHTSTRRWLGSAVKRPRASRTPLGCGSSPSDSSSSDASSSLSSSSSSVSCSFFSAPSATLARLR